MNKHLLLHKFVNEKLIVTLKDGSKFILFNGRFYSITNGDIYCDLDEYDFFLNHEFECFNIVKIEKQDKVIWTRSGYDNKLTLLERMILQFFIDSGYSYIARDNSNALYIYKEKPYKENNKMIWKCEGEFQNITGLKDLFLCVNWSLDEPTLMGSMVI